jgi:hypothetical protein
MNQYNVVISEDAQIDLRNLADTIKYKYKAPISSIRYLRGIYAEMKKLSSSAASYNIQTRTALLKYGPSPRRVNFKKMAIIYNLINDTVYIRRVIPANTIAGL